jgi:NAD(P)H-hydrate epimerase
MACGGMGDVLSGIIGGFLAQGLTPWQAACLGVYSHGLAADHLATETGIGYLASEVAQELPYALEDLRNQE